MEYGMLTIAVTMFSVQFLFNQIYQNDYGNDMQASVQYPFVTGGVMIMSTIICTFTSKKPSVREWISVALSFVGLFVLMLG